MKTFLITFLITVVSLLCFLPKSLALENYDLRYMPVQDGGRIKPFDTFAIESLQLIYGKSKLEGRPAVEIVMTWLLQPEAWEDKKIFEIKFNELKTAMKFPVEEKYFSMKQILQNERLSLIMQELQSKRESKEKLTPYFQAIQRLENQLTVFREIGTGRMLRVVPNPESDTWKSLPELSEEEQQAFAKIAEGFIKTLASTNNKDESGAVPQFVGMVAKASAEKYADMQKIKTEVWYNQIHPFMWTWIIYLLAAVLLILAWITGKSVFNKTAWALVLLGFVLHILGMAVRTYLTARAPVTNMYETVVWVGWGAVLFAMIIEYIYKQKFILLAGSLVGFLCLLLGDLAPVVLDKTLQPLEPVLRSNFWLTVHVMTITISYAAFFLAFALSDIGLVYFLKDEQKNSAKIKAIVLAVYRSTQIGVSFLAPGIILGGIWADYSWGRFWGWDPKETWALIALLGYIAVLHGRLAGLIKDFGMLVSGVLSFSLVIMAWYGVNFILGAGLHSYGFGAGGVEYVAAFVGVHVLYVVFVTLSRKEKLKQKNA